MRSPAHKKTQEMWCAAHFGLGFEQHCSPCAIDIDDQDAQTSADFDLVVRGQSLPFQVTEVQTPGRRRGDEYKGAEEPQFVQDDWIPGTSLGAEWIRDGILRKVRRNYAGSDDLHLLVYVNFPALSQDYREVQATASELLPKFASVWLLNGNAFCCAKSSENLPSPEGWKMIPESLAYDEL